jgi:hypothetical protein
MTTIVEHGHEPARRERAMDDRASSNSRPSADIVAARKREIAQRYGRRHGPQSAKGRITSLRRAQALRLLKHRHGATLPDNADGRAALQVLLELGLDGMGALAVATWASGGELDRLIEAADDNWRFWGRDSRRNDTITQRLGERLEVTFAEKTALRLYHLGCIDADLRDVADHYRKRKNQRDKAGRVRKREQRSAQEAATTTPGTLPTGWELKQTNPRAFALAVGPLIKYGCWEVPDLASYAGQWLDVFKGLRPDALRQAVHRALTALQRPGLLEVGTNGRRKVVQLLASDFAEDLRDMIKQESLEELQWDTDAGFLGSVEED